MSTPTTTADRTDELPDESSLPLPLRPSLRPGQGAWVGLAAGGLAVTLGMLIAAVLDVVSPIDAVGSAVIDRTPQWLAKWAIEQFGTNDKLVLRFGIVVVLAVAALSLGALAVRRAWVGVAGIATFGLVGALAAASRAGETSLAAVPSVVGALVGAALLGTLLRRRPIEVPGTGIDSSGAHRRRFLATTGSAAVAAATAGALAEVLSNRRDQQFASSARRPTAEFGATGYDLVIPSGADLDPTTPYLTPNDAFYRIDTALRFPRVDIDTWSVSIRGMVDRPLELRYADLLERATEERVVTICCVSNEVGGQLIGNAVWRGVMLRDVLDEAGVRADAEQVYSTSVDGWTCGFPVAAAFDGRDAMIAVAMNGEPLPLAHGFPARLIVPGLYGYVSATKWLSSIELTGWDREGYWVPRGWSREGPIKTQSRIGFPRSGERIPTGPARVAGVAWAQGRGIAKVEVQIDDGDWREATMATDVSADTWRQWVLDWDATPGEHVVRVRATDGDGATQTDRRAPVAPDGATGWHTIRIAVADA